MMGALPRSKTVASEDREEWVEVKAEEIQDQRHSGDCLMAWTGRKIEIIVDRVLRARGKMKHEATGPRDCLVTGMLQELPMESVFEITHWFKKRFRGNVGTQRRGTFYVWCSSRSLMRSWRAESIRGFRATALMSVLAKVQHGPALWQQPPDQE